MTDDRLMSVVREADVVSQNVAELLREYAPDDSWAHDLLSQVMDWVAKNASLLNAIGGVK